MQNIKIWLIDEKFNYTEKSDINFAPVLGMLFKTKNYENKYQFLACIDPYGYTFFNLYQAPKIIQELNELKKENISSQAINEIINTIEFLKKIEQGVLAIFIGD